MLCLLQLFPISFLDRGPVIDVLRPVQSILPVQRHFLDDGDGERDTKPCKPEVDGPGYQQPPAASDLQRDESCADIGVNAIGHCLSDGFYTAEDTSVAGVALNIHREAR